MWRGNQKNLDRSHLSTNSGLADLLTGIFLDGGVPTRRPMAVSVTEPLNNPVDFQARLL